ncbi:MAG: copper amine oxidase N-terminal domain-containing protein [Candidatus Eremiobacteraeota bacterium]|nr:copper amine oxidase N-terminal domain-containing protein [Candidatus Eremiobacteraeota bacterium]
MLKKTFIAASSLVLLGQAWAAGPEVQTTLDGRPLHFDQPAVMQEGRVMVPLRGIFESLGADVLFDNATRTIKATKGDRVVELALGSREAMINGQLSYLDVPASSIGGRTLVPLRFVSEALGADVRWSPASRTVALSSSGEVSSAPIQPPAQSSANAPQLSNVVHNARRGLSAGDTLVVTATGDPGARASFDIMGVTTDVPMREVSSGRYEGEFVVKRGMQVQNGTLVARLSRNGQESVLESRRAVDINGGSVADSGGFNGNSSDAFQVTPAEGAIVNSSRPTVHVNLDSRLTPGTARVFLDGNEVTNQAQVMGSAVHFVPAGDLSSGYHRVSVQAVDRNGRLLSRDWDFSVSTTSFNNGGGVFVTNLNNGSTVGSFFNVQGQAAPFSQVSLVAQAERSLIPGVIGVQNQVANITRQADGQGRFDIPVDASRVPRNTTLELRIQASDPQGRSSTPTQIDVTRR